MKNNILEISKRATKGGKVPIKIVLHKIHEDQSETNKNGLHWKEEYVQQAKDTVKSIPICAEFADNNKGVPLGHGYTETIINENGDKEPVFKNSDTVGVIETASIERVNVNGENILALVGEGVLFKQRYPEFVSWVRKGFALNQVLTSIEIMGLEENDNAIVYEENNPTPQMRTSKEYQYTGVAILSVEPADDDAVVLEVAQKQNINKEDCIEMEFNMDEVKSVITNTITELNNKEADFKATIESLNEKIAEINSVVVGKESEIVEKDEKIKELNNAIEELNATITKLTEENETHISERESLEKEVVKAKITTKLAEMNNSLKVFSDAEKEMCQAQIDACKTSIEGCEKAEDLESKTVEINALVSKIYEEIGKASKVKAEEERQMEINSKTTETVVDIFSGISVVEEKTQEDEDVSIF